MRATWRRLWRAPAGRKAGRRARAVSRAVAVSLIQMSRCAISSPHQYCIWDFSTAWRTLHAAGARLPSQARPLCEGAALFDRRSDNQGEGTRLRSARGVTLACCLYIKHCKDDMHEALYQYQLPLFQETLAGIRKTFSAPDDQCVAPRRHRS